MKLLNSLSACSPVENAGQFSRSGNVVMTLIRNANMFNVKERKGKKNLIYGKFVISGQREPDYT